MFIVGEKLLEHTPCIQTPWPLTMDPHPHQSLMMLNLLRLAWKDKQFVTTLEDVIPQFGAPTKLISDREQVEISNKVLAILHALVIGDWQCEPHYQHQNFAERHWQTFKHIADTIVDRTGSPPYTCLLALIYAWFVWNHTALYSLKNSTPL